VFNVLSKLDAYQCECSQIVNLCPFGIAEMGTDNLCRSVCQSDLIRGHSDPLWYVQTIKPAMKPKRKAIKASQSWGFMLGGVLR